MFSPQKCREDSQLSPTTTDGGGHITPVWGFSLSYFTKMSGCYAVGLAHCESFFSPEKTKKQKGSEEHHVCRLYCLPPFNGTLSRPFLTAWASSGSSACVFLLTSRISSLTFLCVVVISDHPDLI